MYSGEANGLRKAFLNEILMTKRLAKTSRHIIHMYDFDFHQTGLTFIVMELGQQDLEKALINRPALLPVERKAIWRQLVNIAVTLYNRQIVNIFYFTLLAYYFLVIYRCILISNLKI
jgi:hypothetical protein